jgi:hypothetical protein
MQRTNTHHNQETSAESPEIHNGIATALHEVIGVRASSADPVRQRGKDVGCNDQERKVLLEQGTGENYEEKADCKDLEAVRERGWERDEGGALGGSIGM